MEEIKTKVCNKCGKELPIEMFSKGNGKDGLQRTCKSCMSVYMREYAERRKRKRDGKKEKEVIQFENKYKIYTNKELAKFSPRELMLELKARGYEGELLYKEVKITEHRINLSKLE